MPDDQLALTTAATRLAAEFAGSYGRETVERFLHSSYEQFATIGSIPHFLPLLAERFARQRLQALARVEGHHSDGKPVVLFLCTTTPGAPRWRSASSPTSPGTPRWPGPAVPSPERRSTPPRSPPWLSGASTSW
ncbi:three-helix bundle dimerization domain-containing protein [Spirilliplanes yamanashiensis]|uniref:Protein-tyrosine-phosphatase-like N-terminal domain-containing protein n=1 Tax=Spirilliplanes yamanashiensis TaxID=42233 RepID=A0A8J4DM80_9ACTN|nr:hypothetical protein [Spirilliplanes yamanashiensis]MDP9818315.1 hypothetical protein [Spirilliplanes yamanashiensis]GIJ06776.1 hypothetical protein Sya03_61280 [Spirilliplanes yamanashiensis]